MIAEIITIGDEILIGQIVDTNSAFIAKELNKIGVKVFQVTSIQDEEGHILSALAQANERADLVLLTGGLGPTKDDITKAMFLKYFDDTLVEDPEVLANIYSIFNVHLKREPLPSNLSQAMVPSKAKILKNRHGTAPGMWMEKNDTVFVSMPGVPFEMKTLMIDEVLPKVVRTFKRPHIYHKTLLTFGQGESVIQERIAQWENQLPSHIKLAYLPSFGSVRLRLSSIGINVVSVEDEVNNQMHFLSEILVDIAVGYEGETSLVGRISEILKENNKTLSVVESCTGGAIAHVITEKAGVSSFFKGGLVPYSTVLKTEILNVEKELIDKHSVVSIEVAEAMAINSCKLFNSDYAVSTTGVAGPTKGDTDKQVGTVCIAVAGPRGVVVQEFSLGEHRERVIEKAKNKALEMLLKELLKN
ncbi:competence-damage inducible protein [unidentified eubacterium SCB49]|nr:competence-damage inducible protein [unidentified eubacterium SCB49]